MKTSTRAGLRCASALLLGAMLVGSVATAWGRGFGGGGLGGGGGFRGGGGGGFGGGARPSMPSRAPSISRPAPRPSAPSVSRPSLGAGTRPGGGSGLANAPRPGNVNLPGGATRPGNISRPPGGSGLAGGSRPSPGLTPGSRPGIGSPPPAGVRPGLGDRPSPGVLPGGGRPGVGEGRPGIAGTPGAGRPGVGNQLPGAARPGGGRPATLPGLAAGGIAGAAVGDRMATGGRGEFAQNRPNWNDRPGSRQDFVNNRIENRPERVNDLQTRMSERGGSWQDRRDQWQENRGDRQENRGDRWDDFHDNFWDNAYDFRHDYWNNRFDAWWDHMWDEHPVGMAWGLTAWGVNRLSFWFGYGGGYFNPYATGPVATGGGSYCDYSQPLETYGYSEEPAAPADPGAAPAASESAASDPLNDAFNTAKDAFYEGDYARALESVNQALAIAKNDSVLHEFRALVLFAQGKYQEAAAPIHSVLAVGPGWDWTTLISLYPSVDVYTGQLRQLEDAVKASPDDAALHFLLGYHYVTTAATDSAIFQFQEVVRLQPKDTVAVQLIEMLGGPQALPPQVAAKAAKPPAAGSAPKLTAADVVGNWSATGADKSKFNLSLTAQNTFTWSFEDDGKTTTVSGVFAVEDNTLAMQPDAGGTMVAELTNVKDGAFHFAVVGAPPGDQGLDFRKD